ncbi:hypothetical protein HK405_003274 [Cladochytrium tenue]|nr:hypothetical protein HK405_003274 [Cladochytrium tenue]
MLNARLVPMRQEEHLSVASIAQSERREGSSSRGGGGGRSAPKRVVVNLSPPEVELTVETTSGDSKGTLPLRYDDRLADVAAAIKVLFKDLSQVEFIIEDKKPIQPSKSLFDYLDKSGFFTLKKSKRDEVPLKLTCLISKGSGDSSAKISYTEVTDDCNEIAKKLQEFHDEVKERAKQVKERAKQVKERAKHYNEVHEQEELVGKAADFVDQGLTSIDKVISSAGDAEEFFSAVSPIGFDLDTICSILNYVSNIATLVPPIGLVCTVVSKIISIVKKVRDNDSNYEGLKKVDPSIVLSLDRSDW